MSKKYSLLVSIVLLLTLTTISSAVDRIWDNGAGDGNWTNAINWASDILPNTTSDYARIRMTTGPVFSAGRTATAWRVYLEGTGNGTLTVSGGTLNTNNHIYAGVISTDTATLNMSSGDVNIAGTFYISRDAGSVANINLSGGTITCGVLTMGASGGTGGRINLSSTGTLIITSSSETTTKLDTYITNGWIRAYDGVGVVMVDVNNINPGKTTVWATASTKAGHPSPANGATNVSTLADLSWTGMLDTISHDVYFGTDSTPDETEFQGNQPGTTFDPGRLNQTTTYYWRIDEVNDANVVTTGDVWSFTTAKTKAAIIVSQFCPANGATSMPIGGIILTWTAGAYADSHDVYFGTASSGGTFQVNQPDTNFALPTILTPNITYYWRIDEKDSEGATVGDVWSFTTGDPVGLYPYLTWKSDPTTTITVNWWNPAATGDSSVDYGLTNSYGSTANNPTITNFHHVEVTGLSPATTYYYQIRSTDGTVSSDPNYKFTTAEVNTTSFRFAMFGDVRGTQADDEPYYTRHQALCNWVLAQDFDFALQTGDTPWEGASLKAIGKWWPDFFRLESNLSKSKVIMATLGNHEVQGGGSYYYWDDFYTSAFPDTNSSIPGNNGRVYSFDYGNVHFVCPSTYQVNLDLQTTWLIADLTAAKANPNIKWIFVYFHAPMFTNSGHANRTDCIQRWGPVFDQFGVNAVFQGHNHVYERSYPLITYYDTSQGSPVWTGKAMLDGEGTVYITNGMGGAEFNNTFTSSLIAVGFGASNLNTTVVVSLTIDGDDRVIVDAIRNDTGAVIDTYDILPYMLHCDFNKDGIIDMKDLGTLAGSWLETGIWP
jgi:hypothetical protein